MEYFAFHCRRHGIDLSNGRLVRIIELDAQLDAAAASATLTPADTPGAAATVPVTFLAAQGPDPESRERLEAAGRYYFAAEGWVTQNGQAKHAAGSGGDPRYARALFEGIRLQFRKVLSDAADAYLDYRRQEEKIVQSNREPDGVAIRIILIFATLGGMGPGLLHAVKRESEVIAQQHGLNVRLLTLGLSLGTIAPVNPPQGIHNEHALLHYAQADLVADLDYAEDGGARWTPAAESFMLTSNINRHGAIPTLARLQHLVGLFLFHYICKPLGRLLDERIVDVEKNLAADEWGGPACASTFGLSVLHLDADRWLAYSGQHLQEQLCRRLLAEPPDRPRIRRDALQHARSLSLVEADGEPLASRHVARLGTLGNVDLFERVRHVFHARLHGLSGVRLCRTMMSSRRTTESVELDRNLLPALRQACGALYEKAVVEVRRTLNGFLMQIDGLRRAQHFLADLRAVVEASADANLRTARALAESLKSVYATLADLETQINHLANLHPILRCFLAGRAARLATLYRTAAETDLRGQAELRLRHTMADSLFRPLLAFLGEEAARIDGHIARFEALGDRARSQIQALAAEPGERLVPVGMELVKAEFLVRRTSELVTELGGHEKLLRLAFSQIGAQLGSIQALAQRDIEDVESVLEPICQLPFEVPIRSTDVFSIFCQEFPDASKQREIIEQLLHEAEGRLLTTGEAGQPVTWIKLLGLGNIPKGAALLDLVKQADREQGDWFTCEQGDPRSIAFLMYRSGISPENLLLNLRRRHPDEMKPLTPESGPDPLTFVLPPVRPSSAELAVSIVHGLAADQVRLGGDLLTHVDDDTGQVCLGQDFQDVLDRSYRVCVRLAVDFVRALACDRRAVLARLGALRTAVTGTADVLKEFITEEAVLTVQRQADQLWPYLRRLPPRKKGDA